MTDQEREKYREKELIDLTEMISDYLNIFKRTWKWALIFAVLGAGVFWLRAERSYQPLYTASSTFTINIQRNTQGISDSGTVSYYNNSTAEQMVKTFPNILTSGVLKRKVAQDLQLPSVPGTIRVSVLENTNLLAMSVTDLDGQRAYDTLKSVEKNYPEVAEVIVGRTYMEMLDETGVPKEPDNPRVLWKTAVKGGIFGALLILLWTGFLVFTKRTISRETDIRKRLNLRCLGSVPQVHEKRRTRSRELTKMLITDPWAEKEFRESFGIIRNKIERHAGEYHKKVFLVTSAAAGEGKSTIAVNLAIALAEAGKKVALIDCDLRHPTDRQLFRLEEDENGIREVLEGKKNISECIKSAKDLGLPKEMKLAFLPGGKPANDAAELLDTELMKQIVGNMKEAAEFVILDSAPVGVLTDAAVLAQYAESVVYVIRKDFANVDSIIDGMDHLAESQIQFAGGILNGV